MRRELSERTIVGGRMKRSFAAAIATGAIVASLVMPVSALAFQITGGGGSQTQNPYGYWYAGKEACAQEGCHAKIAALKTPHSEMVKDIRANPEKLHPAADSGLWPFTSPLGGISVLPRDIYLQLGDHEGFLEYTSFEGSALTTKVAPIDDLGVWSPANFLIDENKLEPQTSKLGNGIYMQSCGQCHNVGVTRPSNATYTLPSGAVQTTKTPSTVSELGIQCEACHGSGKNPDGHKKGVPGVVGGYQILKAQVCGQCHVTATTPQKNVAGSFFGNPNGFTTDATLTAFLTPSTAIESSATFMAYVNNPNWPGVTTGMVKPKFLPNGADFSMRHTYYNEWLVNKVPSPYGGDKGHADPVNEIVKTYAAGGETRCLKCHSGLGFLNRIDAKAPTGTRIVPTFPTMSVVTTADPGISCQVCHTGHVGMGEQGGYDSMRRWGNGKEVSCGDCHNWQFEALGQAVQYETIAGVEYTRPAANSNSRHAQREMMTGGHGGEDGLGGLWGVAPMDTAMPDTECKDCHMPRTHKEGMPADDSGTRVGTRMSHRFHIVEPGEAKTWKLRPNGDSCALDCHKEEAAEYSRDDMQNWIDQKRAVVANASSAATGALDAVAVDLGLTDWNSFLSAQPGAGDASALSASRWAMLQHAAQNVDFVVGDGSGGLHNPDYALAGLAKARLWAASTDVTLDATLGAGPALGYGMTVTGTLLDGFGAAIPGAEVSLEMSTDSGATWSLVKSGKPNASGAFSLPTGGIVGDRTFRVRFAPSAGVEYISALMPVKVPVTTATVIPAGATSGWLSVPSVQVTMSATSGSLTYYTLTGATVRAQTLYTGTIDVTAEGKTTVTFWSTDGNGTEAAQTLPVMIDREAPSISSDLAAVYANKAVVHAWATDGGTGVDSMRYVFETVGTDIDDSSFTFETYKLGKNDLVVSAKDNIGKTGTKTLSVWVKATPSLTMSPAGTKTIARKRSVKFSTRATRGKDGAGNDIMFTDRPLVMQRWSGKKWYTWTTLSSGSGTASWTRKFTTKGTSYWRWAVPADDYSYSAYSKAVKVVVK
jgi:hypothetical protein